MAATSAPSNTPQSTFSISSGPCLLPSGRTSAKSRTLSFRSADSAQRSVPRHGPYGTSHREESVDSFLAQEAQDMFHPPSIWTRHGCWRTIRRNVLPFLKLWSPAEAGQQISRSAEEMFLLMATIWVIAVFTFCYMMLTISCGWLRGDRQGHVHYEKRKPKVGDHYPYVLLVKQVIQVLVMHRLCGCLMEPMTGLKCHRTADVHLMHPVGIVHLMRRLLNCVIPQKVASRKVEERWLSSFVADHLLLFFVGTGALLHQLSLMSLKLRVHDQPDIGDIGSWDLHIIIMRCVTDSYATFLVIGFLYTTLEFNIVAKPSRHKEFVVCMSLFILLWAVDFLSVLLDREVYMSAWMPVHVSAVQRVLAAISQIFVTHSAVMLGAVLLGHSCHFKRSPDLTWSTFFYKGAPCCCVVALYIAWCALRRRAHTFLSCSSAVARDLAMVWPYFHIVYVILSGAYLLVMTLTRSQAHALSSSIISSSSIDGSQILNLVDYDTALVLLTFSMATVGNVNQVLADSSLAMWWPSHLSAFELLGPIGLAAFTMSVWRKPPRPNSSHGKLLVTTVWFALLFAVIQFVYTVDLEDCETSSNRPACCQYPYVGSLHGHLNTVDQRNVVCDAGIRCSERYFNKFLGDTVFCGLVEEEEDPGASTHAGLRQHVHAFNFTQDQCQAYMKRWDWFRKSGALEHESEKEELTLANAYKFLKTIGGAATVEMYFTIIGVLLKVLFLTQHPNSEKILNLEQHHHYVGHEGHNEVVAVDPVSLSCSIIDADDCAQDGEEVQWIERPS